MSANLSTVYYAIKDPVTDTLQCGYTSLTNGLYSTPGKAQSYIDRKVRRSRYPSQAEEYKKWKIVPVKIVEVTEDEAN
ncbi:hypothetical protein EVB32_104 [Rhizobium phage RHph_TM39]|uniref:Uncharacterized protein n=1 Tax=Rhizobium phage RHph_TM30 TaxID=2509764 RepID=A0A7S5UWA0_9CAUD|nr:hypothetical protein PQC16_gp104 [Rhizobium phage RHph_TM30]QIG71575.1 hypothetical protein EVB94_104 [Rhizobium phage RHph_TM40]QIG71938.1 hypothetical protein EVB95_104 [Rhizobium phage RHph_TM2_3B]QIG72300.1 hypothetical protein EVB96_104 [Rhizobium phage RHph_TM3_3_6]QIG77092.1 hypothetical protein EVB32_104 [Rhizobium phage RHph_TM39]QIG77430.1 hypothetical protein EVB61_102 [Rhizobium phage RHph_TM21B]QIG77691.1 hypothetical protein EVB64_104 [Rhizobium phage RHph_TM61]